jgi:hypothetical protein
MTTSQSGSRSIRQEQDATTGRRGRWMLNRAGIINVYQYGNEILHFGGGRLLLRGVNGSGKSTAMNMLLPFLLDGDTRRIDAAGEQSGVLKAWMLAGREEAQAQGYLWLEVAKGDSYLTFGCGIRANRATDLVNTWWFITSRRVGHDLHLVEGRVPVSREALRTQIEPDPLFGQEQRADYRIELRKRLFGGADIEQHLHLLRTVRNPRVGDRLDAELPQYLQDALPQLSDSALDDAAQPLEDLEEHRRNVAELRRTAEALDAVHATYCNYARAELHRLADRTLEAARMAREHRRSEEKAQIQHHEAINRRENAEIRKRAFEAEITELRTVIAALEGSDAYRSGGQLNDLRKYVESLERSVVTARGSLQRLGAATARASGAANNAHLETQAEHDSLRHRLTDLAHAASRFRLTARPPSLPSIAAHPSSPTELPLAPAAPVETAAATAALSGLSTAVRQRLDEVDTVESAVRAIEPAEQVVRGAERAADDAQIANQQARAARADAHAALQLAVEKWQTAVATWVERLGSHYAAHGLGPVETPSGVGAVVHELVQGRRTAPWFEAPVAAAVRHHETQRAQREALLDRQSALVNELEERAAELATKQFPDPPMLTWQRREGSCFAELIDFSQHLEAAQRSALEAALEASGLLAAEVQSDGALRLADGQLILVSNAVEASTPLSTMLCAETPIDDPRPGIRALIDRILHAISIDLDSDADTVVTADGEFRIGAMRGRHNKAEAEHIGVTARRAALQRKRDENALALEQARAERSRYAAELDVAQAALDAALAIRADIPSDQSLLSVLWQRNESEKTVDRAEEKLRMRRSELQAAEQEHADAVNNARTLAAHMALPTAPGELRDIRGELEGMITESREAQQSLARLARAVERWRACGVDWLAARADEDESEENLRSVSMELNSSQERLTTLDATIGAAYQDVIAKIEGNQKRLTAAQPAFKAAELDFEQAVKDVATTDADSKSATAARERADVECVQVLVVLRRALAVPGLTEAAAAAPRRLPGEGPTDDNRSVDSGPGAEARTDAGVSLDSPTVEFPIVEDTAAGARQLGEAIRSKIPRPDDPPTTADGVRQSIRRRRDSLGAGWDAEDRQPHEQLPLHIEVTGPLAQQTPLPAATKIVQRQLIAMTALLSAKQHQALRNLLQGLVAREVADKLHAADELIERMNVRLSAITTSHGIGVKLRWRRRDDLDPALAVMVGLLSKPPDLRTVEEDAELSEALGRRIDDAHREDPGIPYRELISRVLDYRTWHLMTVLLLRPGRTPERLTRRTALSEGEKKIVTYLPLFAAVAASCDGLAASAPDALRFVLLDDAFAKVSEDNHPKLFGLLVELDLDFIATSERLWGTHDSVPELAITEVIRDAGLETIVLEHSRWNARRGTLAS